MSISKEDCNSNINEFDKLKDKFSNKPLNVDLFGKLVGMVVNAVIQVKNNKYYILLIIAIICFIFRKKIHKLMRRLIKFRNNFN